MIVTDQLVFIHLHRSGGRFIRALLLRYQPDAREIGYHFPATMIPSHYRDRPVIGFVRNPWDWYRSWYKFNRAQPRSALYRVASADGQLGFEATVINLLHLGSDASHFRQLRMKAVDALPHSILGNRGAGITKDDLANFNDEKIGYYSWLVQRMYKGLLDSDQLRLGRFENFRPELQGLLKACGYSIESPLVQAVATSPPINTSDDALDADVVDGALQNEINLQERWMCERFNYPARPFTERVQE